MAGREGLRPTAAEADDRGHPARLQDDDAGRIAQEAGVKTLVLPHLMPADASISEEIRRSEAAKHFNGEIIVAQDLMVI